MAMRDVLARIEPVTRDLLTRVDAALMVHGAPAEHPVWARLRRLGSTPADAVAFFAHADPEPLHVAAAAVRRPSRRLSPSVLRTWFAHAISGDRRCRLHRIGALPPSGRRARGAGRQR